MVSVRSLAQSQSNSLDHIDIYLHTVDAGSLVYDNFGHTALRVHNRSTGQDLIYNWGIFDFGEPLPFMWRYYQGDLVYKLGVYPFSIARQQYKRERRTVWQDKLVLSQKQKEVLLAKLEWNAQSDNRSYQYDYFFDNCSTRPRDYLNLALDGQLKSQFDKVPSEKTFRDYIHRAYASLPPIQLLLDVGLNDKIDQDITVWETMFHPLALRQAILDYNPPIVIESQKIYSFPSRLPAVPDGFYGFSFLGLFFLVPTIFLLFFGIKGSKKWRDDKSFDSKAVLLAIRLMGLLGFLLYGFAAVMGLLFPINSAYSGHEILKNNVNSLLFFPLDFILLAISLKWLITGRPLALSSRIHWILKRYVQLHVLAAFSLLIAWSLGITQQNVSQTLIHVLPVYLALFSLTIHIGLKAIPPNSGR